MILPARAQRKPPVTCAVSRTSTLERRVTLREPTGTLYSDFLENLNDLKTPNDGIATPCFAGYCDWRIPTIGELRAILHSPYPNCYVTRCLDEIFGPTQGTYYWSSSSFANPDSAWNVYVSEGLVFANAKSNAFYAREQFVAAGEYLVISRPVPVEKR